jgi:hypothetical protein
MTSIINSCLRGGAYKKIENDIFLDMKKAHRNVKQKEHFAFLYTHLLYIISFQLLCSALFL